MTENQIDTEIAELALEIGDAARARDNGRLAVAAVKIVDAVDAREQKIQETQSAMLEEFRETVTAGFQAAFDRHSGGSVPIGSSPQEGTMVYQNDFIVIDGQRMTVRELTTAIGNGMRAGFASAEQKRRDQEMQVRFDELLGDVATRRVYDIREIDERLSRCCRTREQLRVALERFNGRGTPQNSDLPTRVETGIVAR